ncbi:MAG: MerR family transcriptional regulator [Lachnospiraceae bacterium]|nr:MerR family transcriptional regulator [Lachnospiraceae bacterium]
MKINQVEELVGITKKNIRFYEDQGLLSPERNPENGYREYSLKDVNELMKIKFLRKLSIPLEDIRQVQKGNKPLSICFEDQSARLSEEIKALNTAHDLCESIKNENLDYSTLNATDYLERIQKLEEGGQIFMDVSNIDVKNKKGALIAAVIFCLIIVLFFGLAIVGMISDGVPSPMLLFFIIPGVALVIGCLAALHQRLKEIKGGEENEARKY